MSRRRRRAERAVVVNTGPEEVDGVEVDIRPDASSVTQQPLRSGPKPAPRQPGYHWEGDKLIGPHGHVAAEMRDGEVRAPRR